MSNLKLPNLSYSNLKALTGGRYGKTIAYATTATDSDTLITVSHHGNEIADVSADSVILMTAGWHSQTTAARLNRLLVDNLSNTPYRVGIRDGYTCLVNHATPKERVYFNKVVFTADGSFKVKY